jgi:hypothetical protein
VCCTSHGTPTVALQSVSAREGGAQQQLSALVRVDVKLDGPTMVIVVDDASASPKYRIENRCADPPHGSFCSVGSAVADGWIDGLIDWPSER